MENQPKHQVRFLILSLVIFVLSISTLLLLADKYTPSLLRRSNSSSLTPKQYTSLKDEIKNTIDRNYYQSIGDVNYEEGEVRGLVSALEDPYTEYLSKEDYDEFTQALNEQYVGIGIRFSNKVEGYLVEEVMDNSPALRSDVRTGDYIFKIDGTPASDISFDDIADRIRGEENTKVDLTLLREGQEVEVSITRQRIEVEQLQLDIQDDTAVITISSFGEDLDSKMVGIINEINDANIENVILDLRSNGGGLLQESIEIASYFMDPNEVVMIEKTKNNRQEFRTTSKSATLKDKNVAVLVNRYSASASEIVAGALRDNTGATLIGEKTFGKGVVQRIFNLSNGGILKLTIAEWFTPNETKINSIGLSPDVSVNPEEDALEIAIEQFSN